MPDDPEVVTQEENPAPSEETQEPVETQEAGESAGGDTQAAPETTQPSVQQGELFDDSGRPWKNRAVEAERKFQEIPQIIQQTVTEALKTQNQPVKQEYTIEQIEAFVAQNPKYRPWAEAEKAKIIQRNLENAIDAKIQATNKATQAEQIRQHSENWVINHPKFKECFNDSTSGRKVWNMNHPLTSLIGEYLNQVDPENGRAIKDRPDGIVVAAKMAYADYALNSETRATSQVTQMKRDLKKAQRQTMVTGGRTTTPATPSGSPVRKHLDNYNKTYSKRDIADATKAYLVASGIIKE